MHILQNLTKDELLEVVRSLQQRVEALEPAARGSLPGLDVIYGEALEVLNSSGIPAFIYDLGTPGSDREFALLAVNEAIAALTGYSREELLDMGLAAVLAHDGRDAVKRRLGLPRDLGFSASAGWRCRTRSGEIREIEASGHDLTYGGRRARFVILQDVTRRKQAQLTQQRLASIVEGSQDAILSSSVDGTVLSWNRAAERLFGYRADEIVGRSVEPLLPPEIAEQEKASVRSRILAGEAVANRETVRLHKNGQRIDVSVSVSPLRDPGGLIVGASTIVRDIRARKDAERSIAENHERLRALAALSYDWCWEQDENLRFTYHSGEWAQDRAGNPRAVLGRTWSELPVTWLSQQQQKDHAQALAERKAFRDIEYRVRSPGGEEQHFIVSGEPVFDPGGRFRGYRGIGRDITRQKQDEQGLRLLSAVVDASGDAIMSWSLDGTLLSWNRGAARLLGYDSSELLGKSAALLMPPGNGEWESVTRRVAAGESIENQPSVRRHHNGTMIPVAITYSPMRDESGVVNAVSAVARDVRHQKLQEHLIAESHQRLKLALESAGSSLWDWDIPASRVHYDDAFARMLGYRPAELPEAGRPWQGLLHPDDEINVSQRVEEHLEGRSTMCELELRLRDRHGDWIWIGARGRVVTRDWAGNPVRMMGTCQEISQRKRAEHVEQMLSAFLDSSEDAIVSRTLDGTILSWNRGAQRILGFAPDEMVGKAQRAFVPPDQADEETRISELARSGTLQSNIETVRRHKNGRDVHLSLTCAPLRDAGGQVVGVAWIGRDITARKHADAARSLLAAVVESSRDAIISHDLDSTILSWNRAAEEMFGYTAQEAVGRDYRLLITGEALQQVRERRSRIQGGEKLPPFETVARRKDGTSVQVSISAAALRNEAGEIGGVAVVVRDISSQKRLEWLTARTQAIGKVGGWELDCRSEKLFWTEETYHIYDLPPGHPPPGLDEAISYYAPQVQGAMRTTLRRASEIGEPFDLELPMLTHKGRSIWVRAIGEAQRENGQVAYVHGSLQDITERKQAEQALRRSEQQLDTILDHAAEALVVLSPNGTIERINRQAQRLFGCEAEEVTGGEFGTLILELGYGQAQGSGADMQSTIRQMLGERQELTGRRKDGATFPVEVSLSEIQDGGRASKLTAAVRDITERKSWESRISTMAYSDSLTGLPNRLLLQDRLEHAIASAQRNRRSVGVLFLDLDHFKTVNDSYGHHAGDQLLRALAERIRTCIREIDTVSRLGGDEFVVVLPEIRFGTDAGAVARKILQALAQPYAIDGHEIVVTPTVGISLYPQDGTNVESLLRNADAAMYQAKLSGKNRFAFFRSVGG